MALAAPPHSGASLAASRLLRRNAANCKRVRVRAAAAASAVTAVTAPLLTSGLDEWQQLASLAGASCVAHVGRTPLGRGLVADGGVAERQSVVSVPVHAALVIADDPLGLSIYSDRHQRRWQEAHGALPQLLLDFLQDGEARWDVRMAAWLLWLLQHPGALWRQYLQLLPSEQGMSCMLNYSRQEIPELQLLSLQSEAVVQADWCAHLHDQHLSTRSGSLRSLRLSDSLQQSLWALSMVRSRTFSEDVNGESLTLMVPYADLANHSFASNATFCLSKDHHSFCLNALQPLSAGEEITISYGAVKPNAELLRDYGFIVPGNPCDRLDLLSGAISSSSSSSSAAGNDAQQQQQQQLPGLNPVSILEALGFSGNLAAGEIAPAQQHAPEEALRWARRRCALLSLPLRPLRPAAGSGGIAGWLSSASQAWSASGQPPPEPLRAQDAAAERAAVQQLQQTALQQLVRLPTSIDADVAALAEADAAAAAAVAASGSSGSGHGGCSDDGRSAARVAMAIRARLEHKLLLKETVAALMMYDAWLGQHFG